jgi:branched-chain amino acid transport system ATP-binding protein
LLSVDGLDAFYGDVQVLKGVGLQVPKEQVVTVVGANAAGKTTTLRAISGVIGKVRGEISFEGQPLGERAAHERVALGLVHVPEGRRLFQFMTVEENLEMGCYPPEARKHRQESLERVYELLPRLYERRQQRAGSMSGGEQQMCAIGRGLMARPKLVMLDEPTLGLAPILVQQVFDLVGQLREQGLSVLLVEQNAKHALGVADHAYVLENGQIALEGKGSDLLNDDDLKKAYLGM